MLGNEVPSEKSIGSSDVVISHNLNARSNFAHRQWDFYDYLDFFCACAIGNLDYLEAKRGKLEGNDD